MCVSVVVARYGKYPFASNLAAKLRRLSLWTNAEISKKIQDIIRSYAGVQAFKNRPLHLFDREERTIAILDDVLMPKMKVGSEPNVGDGLC